MKVSSEKLAGRSAPTSPHRDDAFRRSVLRMHRSVSSVISGVKKRRGFTLVELLVSMTLLGLLTVMLLTSFYSVNQSWMVSREVIDAGGHSDYLLTQFSAALRSAYTPGEDEKYGFTLTHDGGDDDSANDIIEWTKIGPALVGEDARFAGVPHRIRVYVSEPDGEHHPGGFTVRAWRQDLQLDEFDPEEDTAELCLSPKVIAFNCRVLDPTTPRTTDNELNWIDEWTKNTTLPSAVEITLWLESPEEGEEPIEYKCIVEIPMSAVSQNSALASEANEEAKEGTSTSVGGSGATSIRPGSGGLRPGGNGAPGGNNRPGGGAGGLRPGGGGGGRPMPPGGGGSPFVPAPMP